MSALKVLQFGRVTTQLCGTKNTSVGNTTTGEPCALRVLPSLHDEGFKKKFVQQRSVRISEHCAHPAGKAANSIVFSHGIYNPADPNCSLLWVRERADNEKWRRSLLVRSLSSGVYAVPSRKHKCIDIACGVCVFSNFQIEIDLRGSWTDEINVTSGVGTKKKLRRALPCIVSTKSNVKPKPCWCSSKKKVKGYRHPVCGFHLQRSACLKECAPSPPQTSIIVRKKVVPS
jgi:hypothetical protein